MIKIDRSEKPKELTEEVKRQLTEEYKRNSSCVWNKEYIKNSLYKMSMGKCCYCETKLKEEGKYMHVEHFHPKSLYPMEVVEWNNLLPSCNRCNISKGSHDTYVEEIINPTTDNPKDYFYINNYRYKIKKDCLDSEKARRTLEVLYLNDTDEIVRVKFELGEKLENKLEDILNKLEEYIKIDKENVPKRNKIIYGVRDILLMAQPSEEYSATMASLILNDEDYKNIKDLMVKNNLWNDRINELEKKAEEICL